MDETAIDEHEDDELAAPDAEAWAAALRADLVAAASRRQGGRRCRVAAP